MWLCLCSCGTKKAIQGRSLRNGHSTRCVSCSNRINHLKRVRPLKERKRRPYVYKKRVYTKRDRANQLQWLKNKRNEYFKDKVCCKCGSKKNLQLDHIDPSTKITHQVWNRRKEFREAELSKCQVLCHSCHKIKTVYDFNGIPSIYHGSMGKYNKGCRCFYCKNIRRIGWYKEARYITDKEYQEMKVLNYFRAYSIPR